MMPQQVNPAGLQLEGERKVMMPDSRMGMSEGSSASALPQNPLASIMSGQFMAGHMDIRNQMGMAGPSSLKPAGVYPQMNINNQFPGHGM